MGGNQSTTVSKLDLSNKGLKDLEHDLKHPRLLPSFSRLVTINLSKNKIEKIPHFIVTDLLKVPLLIEQLTTLSLAKNKIAEIPDAVFTLSTPRPHSKDTFLIYFLDMHLVTPLQ